VVQTLNAVGAEYDTVNILADQQLREGMKAYSNWPTFPQLYVNGELVGGCDIVKDLHARGELAALIQKAGAVRG
jgi:monothiol glutaredoxin